MMINREEIINSLGGFAELAMLYEISAYPKPGLVTPISNGAHKDMDYFTFLNSTSALTPYMYVFAEKGFNHKSPYEIFLSIRRIGIEAEKSMLCKTKGINTHKGMIFLMGITLAATAKTIYEKLPFESITEIIKSMTKGIVENELKINKENMIKENLTYGEKLYLKYGLKGIRGEVESGIPIVFNRALPLYEKSSSLNERERLVHTLICIMSYCEDTTVLHRKSIDTLYYMQERSRNIMSLGGVKTKSGRAEILKLDKEFCEMGISPGGAADLLAITVFMSFVKEFIKEGVLYE